MKKFYFLAAVAVITLGACTQDEETPEQIEVGFNAITKKNSRSIINSTSFNKATDKFKVWGFADPDTESDVTLPDGTEPNFMNGVEISYVNIAPIGWRNAAAHYYWPLTGKVGFYALYPENITPSSINWDEGLKINNYEITTSNSSGTGAVDLMYAYSESGKTSDALGMVFNHTLCQIVFQFKTTAAYPGATIKVDSVTLKKIDLKANFGFIKTTAVWTSNTDQLSSFAYYATQSDAIGTSLTQYGDSTLMIPQSTVNNQQIAKVSFTISQNSSEDITYDMPINLTASDGEWKMNKRYVYAISFKLDEILYNPTVENWAVVENIEYTLE